MRWQKSRQSSNVEDRRNSGGSSRRGKSVLGGGLGGIVVLLAALYFGVDPQLINALLGGVDGVGQTTASRQAPSGNDQQTRFIGAVLGDTEDTWHRIFRADGAVYKEPALVLFTGYVESACGSAQSAMGPFYCPPDQKVYLDLSFFNDLAKRYQAPGDFAQAYVIAHEVGHHVQTLLGISRQVHAQRQKLDKTAGNALSVRQELQADCFAGIWAHYAQRDRDLLEAGDLEEGLSAAAAVGDDRLQRKSSGMVVPESFTHGTSEQRVRWFREGYRTGKISACDTFAGAI
jgi:predicted metalloprotease